MVGVEAATQGVDQNFKFTGSWDFIEYGEITESKAKELMRQLPDESDFTDEYWEDTDEFCGPSIYLSFDRMVKKGFFLWNYKKKFLELFFL